MSSSPILVTGGAGYIGSHVVKLLGERGERVIVLDDLSTGHAEAVLHGEFVNGKTGDTELVSRLLSEHGIDTVMHFAAHTIVPESVSNPLKYYGNNTCSTRNLLEACEANGVKHEYMLRDLSAATDLKHVILRYFNVAGSDPDGRIGQSTEHATLLIKVAAEVALGKREQLKVFGTDFPTADGTGNHGSPIPVVEEPRRAGDPPALVANVDKIHATLDWTPQYNDIDVIVQTSLAWEKVLMERSHNQRSD